MFLNILSADDKYSLLKRDNLRQAIQVQLSQKRKKSSQFLAAFLKSRLSFEDFRKNDPPHS